MTDHLSLWNTHADIDPKMTKSITGKDYKGTSPNAHHIIWCLTDLFGPVGQGFGWRVMSDEIERFGDTAIHWCRIEFWHTDRSNTFETYGQTKMAYMTRGDNPYLKVDEDAPKKSLTDAITKAAAQIGIASNIFLGRWDDNKYVAGVADDFAKRNAPKPQGPSQEAVDTAKQSLFNAESLDQLKAIWGDLPFAVQSMPAVIKAKDGRKSALELQDAPPPAKDDLGGDHIPHQ